MDVKHTLERIDEQIAARHLLKHPFYQAWTAGTLSREALGGYARQYYRQVDAFPLYLAGLYLRCGDVPELRRLVLRNLVEEDHGPENHPELWLRFAEGLGVTREQVFEAKVLPETHQAVQAFRALTVDGSAAEGSAALYAYEAMVPEIAQVKIDGLKRFYGIDAARTLQFFVVHEKADREHREWDRELLGRTATTDADRLAATRAAGQALEAMWTLLDGVQREYAVC